MNIEQKLNREISMLFNPPAKMRSRSVEANTTYSKFLSDKMMIISVIKSGVPYSLFNLIKNVTPLSEGDWAAVLGISTKSLLRHKQASKQFKPIQSEKIIEMAEVANIGVEVFGNMEKFKLWLNTPSIALSNMKPFELLRDSYGKEMVIDELIHIEHGIFV